ncbi:MAG TPA: hypothetical protein VG816_00465 [Solirubrobacterales bacterium]|nr:hypothetical protein [Solirubrobacterales bacterium]
MALTLALALCASGCGGSGQSETSATTTAATNGDGSLSKAEFVKKASSICIETKERSSAAYRAYSQENSIPSSGPGLEAKAADLVESVFVPLYEKQINEIGALGAPAGERAQVEAMLVAMRQGLVAATRDPLAFIQSAAALDRASELATALGLSACGNGNA